MEETIVGINRWYVGWANYFGMTQYPAQLGKIEAHIRRRLRVRIISQQKRKRHLFNKLRKRGVRYGVAAKAVYSYRKKWALSHTSAVEQAYPNRWFEEMGMVVKSNDDKSHWFERKRWVYLA